MNLQTQLLFFFSSLGVFNGLLMSLYFLLFARPKRIPNLFFGLLVLMLTIRIGKSVLHFFVEDLSETILQIGLSACFFIGPFLFFYVRSVLRQTRKISKAERWHMLALVLIIGTVGLVFPYQKRPDLWNPEVVQGIYAVWVGYVIAAGYLLRPLFRQLVVQPAQLNITQKWLLIVFGTNVLICLVFNSILYLRFPSYILGPITFSLVFYALLAFLLFFPESRTIIKGEKQRYAEKKIDRDQAKKIEAGLQQQMIEKKRFEDPSLKLQQLARELQITPHLLSQFLNDNLGKSFPDFVNEYRVQAACVLLEKEHHLSIEGIGKEVGFRSKSSFYAAFKKIHGTPPTAYLKQIKALKMRSEL